MLVILITDLLTVQILHSVALCENSCKNTSSNNEKTKQVQVIRYGTNMKNLFFKSKKQSLLVISQII